MVRGFDDFAGGSGTMFQRLNGPRFKKCGTYIYEYGTCTTVYGYGSLNCRADLFGGLGFMVLGFRVHGVGLRVWVLKAV